MLEGPRAVRRAPASVLETLAPRAAAPVERPPELNGRDFAIFLLRVAAEIEHSLMAQYLFAAYSLGGPAVPPALQPGVRGWQEAILGIAKEEMGHLVTVQNLLTVLGAPLNFNRDDYPQESPLYPFGFRLEPAGLDSLATYICAESPDTWDEPDEDEIKQRAMAELGEPVNRVGRLYEQIIALLEDGMVVADSAFDPATVAFQASWDEWGRGYRDGQRGREAMGALPELAAPELLILPVGTRAEAIAALRQVGEQGEGLELPEEGEESHFKRFLTIYRAMRNLGDQLPAVVRPVAANPTTNPGDGGEPDDPETRTEIVNPEALLWAHLFNVRYRKLLVNVSHAFELSDDPSDRTALSPRGALIHRTFSEMYNLRAIAGLLVRLPIDEAKPDGARAGPPFQMPYTLMLPHAERDRWRVHRDVLDASATLIGRLRAPGGTTYGESYLTALAQWDDIERGQVEQLIALPAVAVNGGGPP